MYKVNKTISQEQELDSIKSKFIKMSGPKLAFGTVIEKKNTPKSKGAAYKATKDWLSELPTDYMIVEML
ncbi:MAG TPA: hypothetical protein PKU78_03550 [Candidatus Dojkabacteria bacterium]|nr:hypothetical protein [Candidatus Dojkabacteria bacterium]HRO65268.1 hypothetical protein [Candidatus Dojkabacteria bacterium]HRP36979.1 hypothetical protein [Candidatus Dojkabacteria bacterium]HRP50840.1 hypothetical protein [Candidatus Dojkabacteria bacterium]